MRLGIMKKIKQIMLQILLLPISAFLQLTTGMLGSLILVLVGYIVYMSNQGAGLGDFMSMFATGGGGMMVMMLCISVPLGYVIGIPALWLMNNIKRLGGNLLYDGTYSSYTAEVDHDIKNSYGQIIGSYTTIEEQFRENLDWGAIFKNILYGSVALPCRIVSLLLSIVALFTDKIIIYVGCPRYAIKHPMLHRYLDIVILK